MSDPTVLSDVFSFTLDAKPGELAQLGLQLVAGVAAFVLSWRQPDCREGSQVDWNAPQVRVDARCDENGEAAPGYRSAARTMSYAGVAKLADAQDLKGSGGIF